MRVFIVGDYKTGSGPANVTYEYIKRFPKGTLYQKTSSKPGRVLEILVKTLFCDVVLCSGYSGQNLVVIKWAHLTHRKVAYMMHGCVEHENAINSAEDEEMNRIERATLKGSDAIFAVSGRFEGWLKANYPEEKDKISHVSNGVEFIDAEPSSNGINGSRRDKNMIFSVGGGMPRKQIKIICEAIDIINKSRKEKGEKELSLVVTGAKGLDDELINSYSFVDNRGLVSKEELKDIYRKSILFIQNSCFETFGLAPMEALSLGCSVLLSDKIGALEVISDLCENDIIYNDKDALEISKKIEYLIDNPNSERLFNSIDKDSASWEVRTKQLMERLELLTT